MSKPFQIVDTTLLEKSLDAASVRQRVTAANIANINTEGYTAKTVAFENQLRSVMAAEDGDDGFCTVSMDPEFDLDGVGGATKASLSAQVESTGRKVDINTEMANQAKSQIMYQALTRKVSGIYGSLKWVVENSGR